MSDEPKKTRINLEIENNLMNGVKEAVEVRGHDNPTSYIRWLIRQDTKYIAHIKANPDLFEEFIKKNTFL